MKIAIQIPIKGLPSERVKNKNFRLLNGKPFYAHLLDKIKDIRDIDIFIDSEDKKVFSKIKKRYNNTFKFHKREKTYSENWSNGNHLINQFAIHNPGYDLYCQLYITAIFLTSKSITSCISNLIEHIDKYDSSFLVTKETGWIWYKNKSINYDHKIMDGLPRSQDANYFKETTGLYVIKKESLFKTGCRIGYNPIMYPVKEIESFDVDTMEDIKKAELIFKRGSI